MRSWLCILVVLGISGIAAAQDPPQGDQLKKMYDETLVQLKAAQERKTELAAENERLGAQLAESKKQAEATQSEIQNLRRDFAGLADRTFRLRSQMAAWEKFVKSYPAIESRWTVFRDIDLLAAPDWLVHGDD